MSCVRAGTSYKRHQFKTHTVQDGTNQIEYAECQCGRKRRRVLDVNGKNIEPPQFTKR